MNLGLLPGSFHPLFILLENSANNPFSLSQCLGLEARGRGEVLMIHKVDKGRGISGDTL